MKSVKRNEDAFTGLEAAIVLIAFVVVAAVFSYVVLGAGFFTTQKSQETVHTAVGQASSAVEILGNVYGKGADGTDISEIILSIGLAAGGTPVDINKTVMTFSTSSAVQTLVFSTTEGTASSGWAILSQQYGNADKVLENGEQFTLSVKPPTNLEAYDAFTIDIKPPLGAALSVRRTVPADLAEVNLLF